MLFITIYSELVSFFLFLLFFGLLIGLALPRDAQSPADGTDKKSLLPLPADKDDRMGPK